jgi:hypothetical protein
MSKIDVCINVYGKPYQTILTLKSLLKHSGNLIDVIYFIEEKNQTKDYNFDFIFEKIGYEHIVKYTPKNHLWINKVSKQEVFSNEDLRLSLRYEYGLSNSNKKHLLLIHNDVIFHSDIVTNYMENCDEYFGIGSVGQCWNCPLSFENICSGELLEYNIRNLNHKIVSRAINKHQNTRTYLTKRKVDIKNPLPITECRINEWCMLVNLKNYRDEVINKKSVVPIGGYFQNDIGVLWFKQMVEKGYRFKNIKGEGYYTHAYFSESSNGHSSLLDDKKYKFEENLAKKYLEENF